MTTPSKSHNTDSCATRSISKGSPANKKMDANPGAVAYETITDEGLETMMKGVKKEQRRRFKNLLAGKFPKGSTLKFKRGGYGTPQTGTVVRNNPKTVTVMVGETRLVVNPKHITEESN